MQNSHEHIDKHVILLTIFILALVLTIIQQTERHCNNLTTDSIVSYIGNQSINLCYLNILQY